MKKLLVLAIIAATPTFAAVSISLSANDWIHQPNELYVTVNADAGEVVDGVAFDIYVDKPGPSASRYFSVVSTNYAPGFPFPTFNSWQLVNDPTGEEIAGAGATANMVATSPGVTGSASLGTLRISAAVPALDFYTFTLKNFAYSLDTTGNDFVSGADSNPVTVLIPEPASALLGLLLLPAALIRRRRRN
jgi:hypothetical protein